MINPGWVCQFYDDDDCEAYIREEYGQTILDYYLRINEEYGAARADLFRYLLLYRAHYADKTISLIDVGPHKMTAFAVYTGIAGIYKTAFHPAP